MTYTKYTLMKDKESDHPTLCAKWLPREGKAIDKNCKFCIELAKELYPNNIVKSELYKLYRKT